MKIVKEYDVDNFIKEASFLGGMLSAEDCARQLGPYVIVGVPSEELLNLQVQGYCVLAELKHLQGLTDEEVADAICKEEAVTQYAHVCIDATQLPQAYFRRVWCKYMGEPVLIAETDRLIIRESVETDAEAFLELYEDESCRKFLDMPPVEMRGDRAADVDAYRRYIAQYQAGQYAFYEYGMWSVVEKSGGRCIGRTGLELQNGNLCLGYAILPQYRGRGYATESCRAVLAYCKECEYGETVFVNIDSANTASKKVYDKLASGFLRKLIK